jgi:DNA-binding transcriptional regulator/RsmH inhibitor MraZ
MHFVLLLATKIFQSYLQFVRENNRRYKKTFTLGSPASMEIWAEKKWIDANSEAHDTDR